jgi:hypothetical protein
LNGLGSYTGTFNYASSSSTQATLDITIKNTSPAANGGYLTAFVLNNPGNKITGATLSSSNANFGLLGNPTFNDSVNGAPYGQFDIGASTFKSFEGGGNPSKGIAVGASATFHFVLTGTGLDTLTSSKFFSTLSVGPGNGQGDQAFVGRFRGFKNEGSDKVPGIDPPARNNNPEPGTMTLCGIGLAGLAVVSRVRKRQS